MTANGGGNYTLNSLGDDSIQDGTTSEPLIRDYALYSGKNNNQYGSYGTKEISGKLPNGYGLYDMQGIVREWTQDANYSTTPFSNPMGNSTSTSVGGMGGIGIVTLAA